METAAYTAQCAPCMRISWAPPRTPNCSQTHRSVGMGWGAVGRTRNLARPAVLHVQSHTPPRCLLICCPRGERCCSTPHDGSGASPPPLTPPRLRCSHARMLPVLPARVCIVPSATASWPSEPYPGRSAPGWARCNLPCCDG